MKTSMWPITGLAILMFFLMPTVYFKHHLTFDNLLSLLSSYAYLAVAWSCYRTIYRQSQSFESTLAPEQNSEFKIMRVRIGILGILAVAGVGIAFGCGISFGNHI